MAVARKGIHRSRWLRLQAFRYIVLGLAAVYFLIPLGAMVEFSTRANDGSRTLEYWKEIVQNADLINWNFGPAPDAALNASLELALVTSIAGLLLLVPTMVWVRLKLPRLNRILEFISLLPLTIPAIVLVVGLFPMYIWLGTNVSDSILTLALSYIVLVLPYAYRSLDAGLGAIDVKTLSEAARSLGASWFTVMVRVIAPNMRQAILNALLLTWALVLGEFTIAFLLLYNNLQVELYSISRNTPNAGVVFSTSTAALLFAFVLLLILSYAGRRRRGRG